MTTARKRNEEIIKKSYSDPVFFIKTFCKIQHPIKGVVPFKLYPFQEELVQTIIDNPYVVVNKSRQLGISTVSAAFCLWYCIFHHTKNILVIATKRDVAKNFVDKCKFMYENLPSGLKKFAPLTIDNAQEIGFGHTNSKIKAVGTSKDAGRSEALSWLFVDEAAFIKDMDDIWTSIWPTLSTGGRCMMLSTPEGTSNIFYQTYAQAKSGENDFVAVDLPWDVHPDRDEDWKEKQIKTFGQKRFDQEYDCVSGDTRIITDTGYKLARDIEVGDLVLTHKGRFKKIKEIRSRKVREDENLYELSMPGIVNNSIKLTGNHPVLSSMVHRKRNQNSFDALRENPKFTFNSMDDLYQFNSTNGMKNSILCAFPLGSAESLSEEFEELDLYDLLSESINEMELVSENKVRYNKQNRKTSTERFWGLDYDFGRVIGLYLAEGSRKSSKAGSEGMQIALNNSSDLESQEFLSSFFAEKGVSFSTQIESKITRFYSCNKFMRGILDLFVTKGPAKNKTLNIELISKTNKRFVKGILRGFFDGDGNYGPNKIRFNSSSEKLIYQIKVLCSFLGHYPRIGILNIKKRIIHGKILKPTKIYYAEIDGRGERSFDDVMSNNKISIEKRSSRTKLINGYATSYMKSYVLSDEEKVKAVVYDFEVEDDHSFIADSLVVHNCDFSAQTNAFLTAETFDYIKQTIKEPDENWRHYGKLWIWQRPIPQDEYAIGVDVASGVAKDYSTIQVIHAKTNEQVAEFHAKVDTSEFAQIICNIGEQYNNAVVCIERNNLGDSVIKKIRDHIGYQKLLFTDSFGNPIVTNTYDGFNTPGLKAGFNMQTKTRINVLNVVQEGLGTKSYKIRSERLLNEFRTFVVKNGKPDHEKNKNDDLIIAYALALWTREYCLKTIASGIEFQESFLNAVSRDTVSSGDLNPDVTGFGMGFQNARGELNGIYSPFGPIEKHPSGGSLNHASSRYDKKKGRVVRTKITDPFGDDRF